MKFLLALFLFISFVSSAQKITDPAEYHELHMLVQSTTSKGFYAISIMTDEEGASLESMHEYRSLLMKTNEQTIIELTEVGGFEGDEELNKATVELLKFYEKLLLNDYDKFVQFLLNDEATNLENLELMEAVLHIANEETRFTELFSDAAHAFADKHGITMED